MFTLAIVLTLPSAPNLQLVFLDRGNVVFCRTGAPASSRALRNHRELQRDPHPSTRFFESRAVDLLPCHTRSTPHPASGHEAPGESNVR